jgi:hypothetical protein
MEESQGMVFFTIRQQIYTDTDLSVYSSIRKNKQGKIIT